MTATATTPLDNLNQLRFIAARIAEFTGHSVEFMPLSHLVTKLNKSIEALAPMLPAADGRALDGASSLRRPVGLNATGSLALRRAAYTSALLHTSEAGGDFERLRPEQRAIDADEALWRQYVPATHETTSC